MRITLSIPLALLLSVPLIACDGGSTTNPGASSSTAGVALFRLADVDGDEVEVTTVAGGRTILAFWATWCQPCQSELTKLDGLYADLASRGLMIYAINVDDPSTASQVGSWVAREGYRFPVLLDAESQILARYHPRKEVPFYVVLDGDARVVEDHQGYTPGDIDALRTRLEQALSQ